MSCEMVRLPLTIAHVRAIYEAGKKRGHDEAVSFDWGSFPTGKADDELSEALHDIFNDGLAWEDPRRVSYATPEEMWSAAITAALGGE